VSERDQRPPTIVIDEVRKTFNIPREQVHTLKERALHPFRRPEHDVLRALRGVSFAVEPGEFFGIVGRNGSGKSTLLKCMAGIYRLDSGQIFVDGRMSTFIELGVGFNPDLAAYDNVMLNATMLGLTRNEAKRRFDRIIEFAELEQFVDMKVKNYSSGMLVRLAFSVMIQVDADVLLIDEVLAVGDAAFQQKCFDEFGRIRRSGATVLLVTHDMGAVQRFCDRAVLLEHGRVAALGDVEEVAARYLELNFSGKARAQEAEGDEPAPMDKAPEPEVVEADEPVVSETTGPTQHLPGGPRIDPTGPDEVRIGDGEAEIVDAWIENDEGERAEVITVGRPAAMVFRCLFHEPVADPLLGASLVDSQGITVFTANNVYDREGAGVHEAGEELTVRIRFENHLAPDRYLLTAAVGRDTNGLNWHDRRERMRTVVVTGTRPREATVQLPYSMDLQATTVEPREGIAR
jgi:ABC-type polysaccharide/polyol phosphate transport system ATPase subunit